jgi:processed acidic surface protein
MKKLGVILLSLSLLFGIYPQTAMAAQSDNFEQELTQYLTEVSSERGFEVTKEDLEASLSTYELSLADYNTVDELRTSLGEVIKADFSNLTALYETYDLEEASLLQLLSENGDELTDYIYVNDLDLAVYFYVEEDDVFERDPNFDQKLIEYLAEVSEERGFEVKQEAIEASLSLYYTSLEEFETVDELSEFLGEVIKADLSNLDIYYDIYDLDEQSLLKLLDDNGKNINDYIYVYDLGEVVWNGGEELPAFDEESLLELMEQLGLTEEEVLRIEEYFISLEDYFADPAILVRYNSIGERILAMGDLPTSGIPSDEQIKELVSIFEDMLSLVKIDFSFHMIKDGVTTPVSMAELFKINDLDGSDLKISLFGENDQFLADLLITSDFIDSIGGVIEDTVDDIEDSEEDNKASDNDKEEATQVKTVKGGKLPKTATNYIPNAMLGLFLALAGILVYRKVRHAEGESIQK